MSTEQTSAPPAGWYPDPTGQVRWWDGSGWTAQTQAATPTGPNTTMAMLANLGGLVGGFIPPLIVYLVDGGKDRFVRHNAAEALNFQITSIIFTVIVYIPAFGIFFTSIASASGSSSGGAVGAGMSIFFLAVGLVMVERVLNIVWSIMGMVRANKQQYWRYPIRLNLVKGSATREELGLPA